MPLWYSYRNGRGKGKGLSQINGGFLASDFDGIGGDVHCLGKARAANCDVAGAFVDILVKGDFPGYSCSQQHW
jgi:hypothetical protein